MGNTTSMTGNQNHDDDVVSKMRLKKLGNDGTTPWSDLNNDVLFVVMMKLGVIDFVSFSGVCKSWRSLALSNRKMFMASRPPMSMYISNHADKKERYCCLKDIEGRRFKTVLPDSCGRRSYVGLTCGYLIFLGKKLKTRDFWLVNPITRHELHFPDVPNHILHDLPLIKGILVFSHSVSGWVFIMLDKYTGIVWFCIAGKGAWNHVSTTFPIHDLHAFMGKIYTITRGRHVFEMRLDPEPKLTLLDIKNRMKPHFVDPGFVSSGENLHVISYSLPDMFMVEELDFGEMKWVMSKKTIENYAFFVSNLTNSVVMKLEPWADPIPWSQYPDEKIVYFPDKSRKCRFFVARIWYFPHECMNVNLI